MKTSTKHKFIILIGDILIIFISVNMAFIFRVKKTAINYLGLYSGIETIAIILTLFLLCFYIFDLYNLKEGFSDAKYLIKICGALILITIVSMLLFYLSPFLIGRGAFIISTLLIGIFSSLWRLLFLFLFKVVISKRNVLIIGEENAAGSIYSLINKYYGFNIVGFISESPNERMGSEVKPLGDLRQIEELVNYYKIDTVIITSESIQSAEVNNTLLKCKMKGINIVDMASFYEKELNRLPVLYIKDRWFLYANGFANLSSNIYNRIKRATDLLVSCVILLFSLPILIIISLAIKVSSKGPLFLIQERVGKNYKPFALIKFRTMIVNAENETPKWAEENDPRITKAGKILRKTRLDELPQLINIIKGDMSLIGPRPERLYFVRLLTKDIPYYSLRFSAKPGLTGWAQVNYKYGASLDESLEKLQYDLYYIKNMSLLLDLRILLKTIKIMLFGAGK